MRIPFRDPGWFATVVAGSTALGLAAAILLLRLLGPSELAVIPTEAWPWSSESVGVEGVGFDTEQIVAAREEERRKLRRELHDGLAPTLAGAGIKLDLARQSVRDDPEGADRLIEEARSDVRTAIGEIRRMARDLRPPTLDALGLEGALREQAASLAAQSGDAPVIIVDVPEPLPPLPAAVEVAAYRIAVEALFNVLRHASAQHCEVRLSIGDDELEIDVVDDGQGSAGRPTGIGTRAMHERAAEVGGEVTIETSAGGGTRVLARLPVDLSPRGA